MGCAESLPEDLASQKIDLEIEQNVTDDQLCLKILLLGAGILYSILCVKICSVIGKVLERSLIYAQGKQPAKKYSTWILQGFFKSL